MEITYLFEIEIGFTVCLKSADNIMQTLVLSGSRTSTMGAAYSAASTGSKVPSVTTQFSFVSVLSCKKYGTVDALQY